MRTLVLHSPFDGFSVPLDSVPDQVFADRMLGDGVAIHPLGALVVAPCAGVIANIHLACHAVTISAADGVEILLHVGLETVGLNGLGFDVQVAVGDHVVVGTPLIALDLDNIATRARSLITPLIVVAGAGICDRTHGRVQAGDPLLTLTLAQSGSQDRILQGVASQTVSRHIAVPLVHGIHARPAARIGEAAKPFDATISLIHNGKSASVRSAVAVMALGIGFGSEIIVEAQGAQAKAALDAVCALIESGMGESGNVTPVAPAAPVMIDPPPTRAAAREGAMKGVRASGGHAIGRSFRLQEVALTLAERGSAPATEAQALCRAIDQVRERLSQRADSGSATQSAIVTAHLSFLDDPALIDSAQAKIADGYAAGFAWRSAIDAQVAVMAAIDDAHIRERIADLKDIDAQVQAAIAGRVSEPMAIPPGSILIAQDLYPSQLIDIDLSNIVGFCLEQGGPTSHVAILAAGMNLPAMVAMGSALDILSDGTQIAMDSDAGWLYVDPDPALLADFTARIDERRAKKTAAMAMADLECRAQDGTRIEIFANIGSAADARVAADNGAEGAGLVRTEFLFLDRAQAPDEAEQHVAYQAIADALAGKPIIARLLDIGGDKPASYLPPIIEENPMLGVRGVRLAFQQRPLLEAQLRALARVEPAGQLKIMIPMVTSISELRHVRSMLDDVCAQVAPARDVALGIMVETPAAAATAAILASEADFLSIGTNDLTQYVLAMDRGNAALADQIDALHPAVLQMIALTCQGAALYDRPVGVCGALAGDPDGIPILLGLGVTELSMVPAAVPEAKARVRGLSIEQCRQLAATALTLAGPAEVRACAQMFHGGQKA